jgi:hypothetical protein
MGSASRVGPARTKEVNMAEEQQDLAGATPCEGFKYRIFIDVADDVALGEVYGRLETMWEHHRVGYNTDGASHVTELDGEVACEPVVASPLLASGTWAEVVEALRREPGYAFYNILRVDDDGYEVRLAE